MELQQEALQWPGARALGQAIRTQAGQAALGLGHIQPGRAAVQLLQAGVDALGVPLGGYGGGHGFLLAES
ncbi:hypothetical protein D9M73_283790 [compost metagenome]